MPVPALFVALADWRGPHIAHHTESQRHYAELKQQHYETEAAETSQLDPVTALQQLFD